MFVMAIKSVMAWSSRRKLKKKACVVWYSGEKRWWPFLDLCLEDYSVLCGNDKVGSSIFPIADVYIFFQFFDFLPSISLGYYHCLEWFFKRTSKEEKWERNERNVREMKGEKRQRGKKHGRHAVAIALKRSGLIIVSSALSVCHLSVLSAISPTSKELLHFILHHWNWSPKWRDKRKRKRVLG